MEVERQEVTDHMDELQETMGANHLQWARSRKSLRHRVEPSQEWVQKDVVGCVLGLLDSSAAQGSKLLDIQGELLGKVAKMMQRLAVETDPVRTEIMDRVAACKAVRATFQRMRAAAVVAGPARLHG